MNLKFNSTYGLLCFMALSIAAIVSYQSYDMSTMTRESAMTAAAETAGHHAKEIEVEIAAGMDTACMLAYSIEGMRKSGKLSREKINNILENILRRNPGFLGVWTCWEPNAFDGRDRIFCTKTGHDATGRFIPYWNRSTGEISLEPIHDYETPGLGDFYLVPRATKQQLMTEPYQYTVQAGKTISKVSFVVPILEETTGGFLGVTGTDFDLVRLQKIVAALKPYETGCAVLCTGAGTIVAHPDTGRIGKNYGDFGDQTVRRKMLTAMQKGEQAQFVEDNKEHKGVFFNSLVPLLIGETKTPWALVVSIPESKVLEKSSDITRKSILIGGVTCAIAILLVLFLSRIEAARSKAEDSLYESEEKYRTLTENLSIGVFRTSVDEQGRILHANQALANIYGVDSLEEMINIPITDIYYNTAERAEILKELLIKGNLQAREVLLKNKKGEPVWCSISAKVIHTVDGSPAWIDGTMENITERKRTEQALRESESLIESIFETDPTGVCFTVNRIFMKANRRFCKMVGYSEDELVGRSVLMAYPDEEEFTRAGRELYAGLKAHGTGTVESRLKRKDGTILNVLISMAPLDPQNWSAGLTTVVLDITDRKRAEALVRASEQKLNSMLQGLPIPMFVLDQEHRVLYWNKALEVLSGIQAAEIIQTNQQWKAFYKQERPCLSDFLLDGKEDLISSWYGDTCRISSLIPGAYEGIDFFPDLAAGKGMWLRFHAVTIKDASGNLIGAVQTLEDITERTNAEATVRLNERRLEALLKLSGMQKPLSELARFVLDEAIRLTGSTIGYLAFLNDDETVLTMYSWSESAMRECRMQDKPLVYKIEETGLWCETVRQRRPIITNDYSASNQLKKGLPEGHVHLTRHLGVPIFDDDHLVMIAGVGNKTEEYDQVDITQLTLLMNGLWQFIRQQKAKDELQQSQTRLDLALQGAALGTWDWYVQTGKVTFNERWAEMLGYRVDELTLDISTWEKLVHPDDMPGVMELFNAHVQGQSPSYESEHRLRTKTGAWLWVLDRGRVVERDADGRPVRAAGTHLDITERKRALDVLRESEQRLADIIDFLPDATFVIDNEGVVIAWNRAIEEMTGFRTEEMVGKGNYEYSIPFYGERRPILVDLLFIEGRETEKKYFGVTRRKNCVVAEAYASILYGGKGAYLWGIASLLYDSAGNVTGAIESIRDISERRRAENKLKTAYDTLREREEELKAINEELMSQRHMLMNTNKELRDINLKLQESERNLAMAIDISGSTIWELDVTTGLTVIKKYPKEPKLGYALDELPTTVEALKDLYHPDSWQKRKETLAAYLRGETDTYELEICMCSKTGEWLWSYALGKISEYAPDGSPRKILGISIDITQIKKAQEEVKAAHEQLMQADKMIALGTLVAGVAHEINNPNNFVMLNTPLVQEAWKGIAPVLEAYYRENGDFKVGGMAYSKVREGVPLLLNGILDGTRRISSIVKELKDFARPDEVSMIQKIDINAVIKAAISLLQNSINKSTKAFTVAYGENLPQVTGNYQRLEQVFINLIQNACQALPDPGRGMHVATAYDGYNIVATVADEGIGIREENVSQIMNPFFTTKRGSGGTGLGLSISQKIITDHGGHIDVKSREGEGSTFTVFLPLQPVAEKIKILIADDEESMREIMRTALSRNPSYEVQTVGNGTDACIMLGKWHPDLIVLDIHMPNMNGVEVCRRIKNDPDFSGVRVMIVTGHPDSGEMQDIRNMGFNDVFPKPFRYEAFREMVAAVLQKSRSVA